MSKDTNAVSTQPKHPPRVWIRYNSDNGWEVFAAPQLKATEYISLPEHEAILREARAEVWDEALQLYYRDRSSPWTLGHLFSEKAAAVREGKE